jgi:hypothetical protein
LLVYGQITIAVISTPGEWDAFAFDAQAGDFIEIRANDGSLGGIDPFVEMFDDRGRRLASASHSFDAVIQTTVTNTARYYLLVSDAPEYKTGPYSLSISGPQRFITKMSNWRYLDDGSDQGTNWVKTNFVDAAWSSGLAQLGYGDRDETTVVNFGLTPNNKYITTYFRRSFSVTNASTYTNLTLRLLRDDGAVVYLNGIEAFRSNTPAGTIGYTALAASDVDGAAESTFVAATINPSLLTNGTNILAVEVHQSAPDSPDLSFDLELIGTRTP